MDSFKTFLSAFSFLRYAKLPWLPKKIYESLTIVFFFLSQRRRAFRVPLLLLLLIRGTLWWQSQGNWNYRPTQLLSCACHNSLSIYIIFLLQADWVNFLCILWFFLSFWLSIHGHFILNLYYSVVLKKELLFRKRKTSKRLIIGSRTY